MMIGGFRVAVEVGSGGELIVGPLLVVGGGGAVVGGMFVFVGDSAGLGSGPGGTVLVGEDAGGGGGLGGEEGADAGRGSVTLSDGCCSLRQGRERVGFPPPLRNQLRWIQRRSSHCHFSSAATLSWSKTNRNFNFPPLSLPTPLTF